MLIDERRAAAVSSKLTGTHVSRHSVLTDFETAKDGEEAREEKEVSAGEYVACCVDIMMYAQVHATAC